MENYSGLDAAVTEVPREEARLLDLWLMEGCSSMSFRWCRETIRLITLRASHTFMVLVSDHRCAFHRNRKRGVARRGCPTLGML